MNYIGQKCHNTKWHFFKYQNSEIRTLPKYVQQAFKDVGNVGKGVCEQFTTHGIRTTTVTLLLEAGHKEQSICKKTGQRNLKLVVAYGNIGVQMQHNMFGLGGRQYFNKNNVEVVGADNDILPKRVHLGN